MIDRTSAITMKEFVEKLVAGGGSNPSPADCLENGLRQGWLETQDIANPEQHMLRKHAARIIHNFLRLEQNEADEIDGSTAYVLRDLFDCRVCAGHIIQVYVKGIMDGITIADGSTIFAAEEMVSGTEAEVLIERVFQIKQRIQRKTGELCNCTTGEPKEISFEYAMQLLKEEKKYLLVDVRTVRDYEEGHQERAVNVPLLNIIKNPFVFSENRDTMLLLYCNEGYQSKAAARCLVEAGYKKVAFFAWKKPFEKEKE